MSFNVIGNTGTVHKEWQSIPQFTVRPETTVNHDNAEEKT